MVVGKLNNSILIMKCKIETSNGIMFLKGIDGDKRLEIADFILMEHVAKLQEIRDYDNFEQEICRNLTFLLRLRQII